MREPTHISSVVLGVLVFPLGCIIVERVEHLAILSINIYDITELSFFILIYNVEVISKYVFTSSTKGKRMTSCIRLDVHVVFWSVSYLAYVVFTDKIIQLKKGCDYFVRAILKS